MEKRQVFLGDGRYLIYYTFEDELPSAEAEAGQSENESPQSEDETHE